MTVRLRSPGLLRGGVFLLLGGLFAFARSVATRAAYGYDPTTDSTSIVLCALIAAPLFFLVGVGAVDHWFYWASGRPTRPDDHSGHRAHSWRDYFKVNTDHKVIGIQYVATSFFFMFIGGLL